MKIDRELYEKVSKLTGTQYEVDYLKEPCTEDGESFVIVYDNYQLESMLRDLICEIDRLEERIEDLKEDRDTNWKRIDIASQVRISDSDFL